MATAKREALRRLIDDLADEQVERLLDNLEDPVLRSLMLAEADDEPLTPEEAAAADEGLAAAARGDVISTEELRRQIGLRDGSRGMSPGRGRRGSTSGACGPR